MEPNLDFSNQRNVQSQAHKHLVLVQKQIILINHHTEIHYIIIALRIQTNNDNTKFRNQLPSPLIFNNLHRKPHNIQSTQIVQVLHK